jgi:hypothetical protein
MQITVDNFQSILGADSERLPNILPQVFAKLVEPNQDENFLRNYAVR